MRLRSEVPPPWKSGRNCRAKTIRCRCRCPATCLGHSGAPAETCLRDAAAKPSGLAPASDVSDAPVRRPLHDLVDGIRTAEFRNARSIDEIAETLAVVGGAAQAILFGCEVVRAFGHVVVLKRSKKRSRYWRLPIATCWLRTAPIAWPRPRLKIPSPTCG